MAGGETTFLVVKNRAYSKLAAALTIGATSIDVTAGDGAKFPSTYPFHLTIEDEIVSVTNRSTDTLTIVRAQQGTSAAAHPNKAYVALNITAKSTTDLNTAVNFIEKYADYGLAFYGAITTIDDTTHFRVSGLAGMGTGWFKTTAGTPYEILVVQADGAAPEGQQTPVVAYTSTGGIFQHAAFSGGNPEVGDEVLIINPLIASLGTKAVAAASGPVTTTDSMMAYIKQILNEILGTDGAWGNLNNEAINSLDLAIQYIAAVIGFNGSNVFNPTVGGVPRTNMDAVFAALDVLLATIDDNVDWIKEAAGNDNWGFGALRNHILTNQGKIDTVDTVVDLIYAALGHNTWGLGALYNYVNHLYSDADGDQAYPISVVDHSIIAHLMTSDGDASGYDRATDSLEALRDRMDAIIGSIGDTATADNLSDIATTTAHAKLRRLLLRFSSDAFAATIGGSSRTDIETMMQALADYFATSGGAYSVSLDGSARANLDAFHTALGVLLGTRDATVSAGVLADTESAMALLRRIATAGSLVHFGDITAVSAGVSSTIADLIGWEDDYFLGWWMMIVRDNGGAGAAPQGEFRQISSYTSTTGLMNHTAFSAADVVGDQAMLIHPLLYGLFAATRGSGPRSLETLGEEQDADLDVARGTSGAVSVDGGEDNVYNESNDNEFVLLELRVDLNNMAEGDTITFKVYTTEDGVERKISEDVANTFDGAQDPARAEIIGSGNQVWGREGIRVAAVKIQGTTRTVTAYYRDAKRGS